MHAYVSGVVVVRGILVGKRGIHVLLEGLQFLASVFLRNSRGAE